MTALSALSRVMRKATQHHLNWTCPVQLPVSGKRLEEALEWWLNQTLDPETTARGIALRGGRLGTVAPGSDWLSVAWSLSEPTALLARQPGGNTE